MSTSAYPEILGNGAAAPALERDLDWLSACLDQRLRELFEAPETGQQALPAPPDLSEPGSPYGDLLPDSADPPLDRLALTLALATELRPSLYVDVARRSMELPDLGLVRGKAHNLFAPTVRMLAFLVAGTDLARQRAVAAAFYAGSHPERRGVLQLYRSDGQVSQLHTRFGLTQDGFQRLVLGMQPTAEFGIGFPAQRLETKLEWADLVLARPVAHRVAEIRLWMQHGQRLLQDEKVGRHFRPGFRALFYGPSGTGKTLTAALLGKALNKHVYRIDLSQIVSKYIGETEKNLARIFDRAENSDWILFFDEADAIFGKRGTVSDARDRYANQEVSYLLQRVEVFDGLCIMASNLKDNIDPAFQRRIESLIHFPAPLQAQRKQLWTNILSDAYTLEDGISPATLGAKYELTGGEIVNVMRFALLMTTHRGDGILRQSDIHEGVLREYGKSGRVL